MPVPPVLCSKWCLWALGFTLGASLLAYYLSGMLIFGGRFPIFYERPLEPVCNSWYEKEVFGDHHPHPETAALHFKVPRCAEAINFPKQTVMLSTQDGLNVRLVIPTLGEFPKIWLHVHGITDSYLNGMRFIHVAKHLGFKLVLLELRNHGGSTRHDRGSSWGCEEKKDLLAALEYIQRNYPQHPILLSGTSMGTLTISETALTWPAAMKRVQAIVYESPISSLHTIAKHLCSKVTLLCPDVLHFLMVSMAPIRSPVKFGTCFQRKSPETKIPTQIWLSREEFYNEQQLQLASSLPGHLNLSRRIFAKGTHSAYSSYAPDEVGLELSRFWEQTKPK